MRRRYVKNPMKSFAVVTKSPAEALFFEQMKKDLRYRNMIVCRVEAETLEDLIKQTQSIRLRNRYDRAWAVASLSDYANQEGLDLKACLAEAKRRKVFLAYANPSIFLYFAMHFTLPQKKCSNKDLASIIRKEFPGFDFTREWLLHDGTEFHLKLFKHKGTESDNERAFVSDSIATGDLSEINFIVGYPSGAPSFLADLADYCGEGDVAYNQKTID